MNNILKDLIDTFEELKKYVFIIDRGNQKHIIVKFSNEHFYHLVGLHKTNINLFFPISIKSKDKKYKYMKSHMDKFNNILINEIREKDTLELRILTFSKIKNMLNESNAILFSLKEHVPGSMYDGDYGLLKIYEQIFCLLGLKKEKEADNIICVPQSWMASNRSNRLVENKKPIYMNRIIALPKAFYDESIDAVCI